MNWQPISTAPKDQTRIIATDGVNVVTMHDDLVHGWVHDQDYPPVFRPTHWMPLPSPPSTEPSHD